MICVQHESTSSINEIIIAENMETGTETRRNVLALVTNINFEDIQSNT